MVTKAPAFGEMENRKMMMMNGALICLTRILIACLSIVSNNFDSFFHTFMKGS
jgi:hypothetical protein